VKEIVLKEVTIEDVEKFGTYLVELRSKDNEKLIIESLWCISKNEKIEWADDSGCNPTLNDRIIRIFEYPTPKHVKESENES